MSTEFGGAEPSLRADLGAGPPARRVWMQFLSDRPLIVLGSVLVILTLATAAIQPSYLSLRGLRNTLLLAAPLGIMAAGQTILMITRGIDLSIAMTATAAAYVAGNQSPNGAAIAIVLALGVGCVTGALNGVGVGILLGLFTQWAQTVLQGSTSVAPFIRTIGAGSFFERRIPWNVLIWAAVAFAVIWGLRRTGFGRMLYGVGDNPVAVRLAGVRSWQVLLAAYTISGFFAALGGILLAGQSGAVDLRLAQNFLLPSVAAAVIGGTSIFGGVGTYSGTILGALILSVLNSMLTFLDAGQAVKQVVYGLIVLALAWLYAAVTRAE
jgi:ribose transport system permease protein